MTYRCLLALMVFVSSASFARAAEQAILGKQEVVQDPKPGVDATKRKLIGQALEKGSTNTIVGDPTVNGATLTFFAFGATTSSQAFTLPAALWQPSGKTGFKFKDTTGSAGGVKLAQIKTSSNGTFQIKATVGAKIHPISVVPPNPGTSGCMLLEINGGDRYHVLFGPDSLIKKNDVKKFQLKDPQSEGLCPLPTTTTTSTSSTSSTSVTTTSVTTTTLPFTVDWYVDAATGLDTNPGTSGAPFKSITHALAIAMAGSASNVFVAPGTYDTSNGEVFPLTLNRVALVGDEPSKGLGTIISGNSGGPFGTAVVMSFGSTLAGFTVTTGGGIQCPLGVQVGDDSVTIRNTTLSGVVGTSCSGVALYSIGTSHGGVVAGNVVSGNGTGMAFEQSSGGGSRYESNVITGNAIGVEFDGTAGDFGGGTAGSAGGNVISCNTSYNVYAFGPVHIDAAQNFWDHDPPTIGSTPPVDIYTPTSGVVVNTTGSQLAASPCP